MPSQDANDMLLKPARRTKKIKFSLLPEFAPGEPDAGE
jgi:hypothetical protein